MSALDRKTRKNDAMESIRIVEEILRRWAPIGVQPGVDAPADEYDSYAPYIVSMVGNGCTVAEVASRLEFLAVETMGLWPSSPEARKHHGEFAAQIVDTLRSPNKSLERTRER